MARRHGERVISEVPAGAADTRTGHVRCVQDHVRAGVHAVRGVLRLRCGDRSFDDARRISEARGAAFDQPQEIGGQPGINDAGVGFARAGQVDDEVVRGPHADTFVRSKYNDFHKTDDGPGVLPVPAAT